MSAQPLPHGYGFFFGPTPNIPNLQSVSAIGTLSAASETFAAVGHVLLSSGPGTTKTISSSGGKIAYVTQNITWATAGSRMDIGIQDVNSGTGIEDGTFDVSATLIQGTETISGNAVNVAAMESGTKSISHGDYIAVVFKMVVRNGADTFTLMRSANVGAQPYMTALGSKVNSLPMVTIQFDDGTVGFFDMSSWAFKIENSATFNSGSTPDEYALIFQPAFACSALGLFIDFQFIDGTTDFEAILYEDPLGTPNAIGTLVQDMTLSGNGSQWSRPFASAIELTPGDDYAIALRPTTANSLRFNQMNFGSGNSWLRGATMPGTTGYMASRTNQSGAFGSANTEVLPLFGVWLGLFNDSVGGGASSHPFVG